MLPVPSMEAHGRSVPPLPTTQQQRLVYWAVKGRASASASRGGEVFGASRSLVQSHRAGGHSWELKEQ